MTYLWDSLVVLTEDQFRNLDQFSRRDFERRSVKEKGTTT